MRVYLLLFLLVFLSFSLFPFPEKEFILGVRIAEKVEKKFKVKENTPEVEILNRIGSRIASAIPASYPFTFTLVEEETANAFSIPGGFIYVTSGVFELSPTEGELAFLIGHEIAHIERRHIFKMERIENLINLLLLTVGVPLLQKAETSREAESEIKILQLTHLLLQRKYSRENEEEADYWGRIFALKAGYPDEAKGFFEKIDFWKEKRPETVYLLYQTHPFVEERKKKVSHSWKEFQYSPPTKEVDKWIEKVQKFLWKEREKLRWKGREIVLRNLYALSPNTPLAGESAYERWKNRIKEREKNKEYYAIINSGEKILKRFPQLRERKSLEREIIKWREIYSEEKNRWERKVGKVESTSFYQKFLSLFPDSSLREKAYEELLSLYEKGGKYSVILRLLLQMEKEKYPGVWMKERKIINRVEELEPLVEYYVRHPEKEVKKKIESLIPKERNLSILHKLENISSGDLHQKVLKRIEKVSEEKYQEGRLEELSGNQEKARDIYWEILKNAPETKAAERIRKDLRRKEVTRNLSED